MGGLDILAIGAGVSGLTAAAILSAARRVTAFEAAEHPGGHSLTHKVDRWGRSCPEARSDPAIPESGGARRPRADDAETHPARFDP